MPPKPQNVVELADGKKAIDITAGFEPLKAQYNFLQSEAKFRLYSGGFGSGISARPPRTVC